MQEPSGPLLILSSQSGKVFNARLGLVFDYKLELADRPSKVRNRGQASDSAISPRGGRILLATDLSLGSIRDTESRVRETEGWSVD